MRRNFTIPLKSFLPIRNAPHKVQYSTKPIPLAYFKASIQQDNTQGSPVIMLHGLYGSKQNWRSLSKRISNNLNRDVYAIDLRNHGESQHIEPHKYTSMTSDIAHFIEKHSIKKPIIVGHSMGGKVAMATSLLHSDIISGVVTVDIGPVKHSLGGNSLDYLNGLEEIERTGVSTLKEADSILSKYEKSTVIRQFILTNLVKDQNSKNYKSRIPLDILKNSMADISDWPFISTLRYLGPSTLIAGKHSTYINETVLSAYMNHFPNSSVSFLETGHWVHSEKPEEFYVLLSEFIKEHEL
ncbi:hypothetical protein BB559_000423 [Furculomyces boomerangus]|uniref:AB hydrolase-1 domain-containing protein n=1 Tax=Furculomyces boomerangus TaxID=61424 RepID=A0A2T9Z590_9FUNG|nr:hypothetical protein BB559_000423 [Furculomyces boomerangus]